MRTYLENKKVYVKNEDNLIYEVVSMDAFSGTDSIHLNLELLGGYDYIDVDYSDVQGYVSKENFTEDLHTTTEVFYFMQESMVECLEENGYTILNKLPVIHESKLEK